MGKLAFEFLGEGSMQIDVANSELRNRYLDLLVKILVNSIYEDPSIGPGANDFFVAAERAVGKDWPRYAHTMVGVARLNNLRELLQLTLDKQVPGDYIETGVWRGGCCILMKGIVSIYGDEIRKVYVADSFEGLPPPKPERFPADAGDIHSKFSELAVSLDQVKSNFSKYDLLDSRVIFVKGFFDVTLPTLDAGPFALVRLDGDMYESTIVALENLYPKLSAGGFIIIDDYGLKGCKTAVDDYRAQNRITAPITNTDWTGIWWQKPNPISEL
jgi:O-methyltransferase